MVALGGIVLALAACSGAAFAAGLAAGARRGARPGAWLTIAAAAALWGLGMLGGLLEDPAADPWPLGTITCTVASALALAGVLRLHGAPTRLSGQARTVVDGLIVGGSTLFVAWTLGLGEAYTNAAGPDRLSVARTLADLVVATCLLVMLTRCRPEARRRLELICGGFVALTVADGAWTSAALGSPVYAVEWLYLGWAVGWSLIGTAALTRPEVEGAQLEPGLPGHASVFVPSAPFAVGAVAAAYAGAEGEFEGFLIWNGAAVIVLIVIRQVLALLENISYWQLLEAKVEARTDELRVSEARFRSLVTNSSDAITVLGRDGTIRYQSPSTQAVLGYRPEELTRVSAEELVHPEDASRVLAAVRELDGRPGGTTSLEFRLRHRDGRWRHVEAVATNLIDEPGVGGLVVNTRDITERKTLEEQLTRRAFEDSLTGLANRALFVDRLGHALRRSRDAKGSLGVLFLDLDEFKKVNDSFGHPAGDEVLITVAGRLDESVRPGDTVARLSGDEFAILVEEMSDELEAVRLADRLINRLEEPIAVSGTEVFMRASIGISTSPASGQTVDELLRNADVAMYTAKARGKGLCEVFEPEMHASLIKRLALERELREALEQEEFELLYQPIVSLGTGRIRGLEALVRWRHPERGLLTPDGFIHLAEETGLIVPIGSWVLEQVCVQARRWQERFRVIPPVDLAVNLSPRQLEDPGLVENVTRAVRKSRLSPDRLVVEITESVFVEDNDPAIARLEALRELGVRVAVDDFGTGYSSLSYLRRLPIDILKIDRSFVRELATVAPEVPLVQAIISMSRSLGLEPIAEGAETAEQADELGRMGCRLAQGHYFARPTTPARIAEMLAAGGTTRGTAVRREGVPAALDEQT